MQQESETNETPSEEERNYFEVVGDGYEWQPSEDYGTPAWVDRVERKWRAEKGTRTDI